MCAGARVRTPKDALSDQYASASAAHDAADLFYDVACRARRVGDNEHVTTAASPRTSARIVDIDRLSDVDMG